jgi:hypothetical protein
MLSVSLVAATASASECSDADKIPVKQSLQDSTISFVSLSLKRGDYVTAAFGQIEIKHPTELISAVAVTELYGQNDRYAGTVVLQSTPETGDEDIYRLPMGAWMRAEFPRHRVAAEKRVSSRLTALSPTKINPCISYARVVALYRSDASGSVSAQWSKDWNFQASILDTSTVPGAVAALPPTTLLLTATISASGSLNSLEALSDTPTGTLVLLRNWLQNWKFLPKIAHGKAVDGQLSVRLRLFKQPGRPDRETESEPRIFQEVGVVRHGEQIEVVVAGLPL